MKKYNNTTIQKIAKNEQKTTRTTKYHKKYKILKNKQNTKKTNIQKSEKYKISTTIQQKYK